MRFPKSEFFPAVPRKSGIAIHHTVGGTARSTFRWWMRDKTRAGLRRPVGTAYIIGRDSTIYEIFDPAGWAFQFGLEWSTSKRIKFEQRFIGIEIASEGGLTESDGRLYCFDRTSPKTRKNKKDAFDYGKPYRGYRYFDGYEPEQIDSLIALVDHLLDKFAIKRQVPAEFFDYYGERLAKFEGVIGHAMVRRDKSDPAPLESLWQRIIAECDVTPAKVTTPKRAGRPTMSEQELDELFRHNVEQIHRLYVPAGSVLKGLIMELARRDTYIRLLNPAPGGHLVEYEFVQGTRALVERIARALGFKAATESLLQVSNGC
jgi:N-acetyl-anhydromuramyl-L-alanine amidase AmpD